MIGSQDPREALEREIDRLAHDEKQRMITAGTRTQRWPHTTWLENTSWVNAYKAYHGCLFCEERDPACLDCHHRDTETKIATVSSMVASGRPIRVVIHEVRKCDVVCANCHRKTHHRERYGMPPLTPRG